MPTRKIRAFFQGLVVLPVLILVSCVGRIGENDLLQVKDSLEPEITILSPANGSSYAAMVEVTGIVTDTAYALLHSRTTRRPRGRGISIKCGLLSAEVSKALPFTAWPARLQTTLALVGSTLLYDARDVDLSGTRAFVADSEEGLKVLDITVPETPSDKGSCPTTNAIAVVVYEDRAYLADGSGGQKIVDINPESSKYLQVVGSYEGITIWDIALSERFLYAAAGNDGLLILDVDTESPTYLQVIGSWDSPNQIMSYNFDFIRVRGRITNRESGENSVGGVYYSYPMSSEISLRC